MKKFLALTLTLASVGFAASTAEAKAAGPSNSLGAVNVSKAAPVAVQWDRRGRGRSRVRVTTQSRYVRRGRQVWRETYQTRYLPNGRTVTRLVSRVRVR
jgi:hypothetical protein